MLSWTASPRRQAKEHLNTFPLPVRLGVQLLTQLMAFCALYVFNNKHGLDVLLLQMIRLIILNINAAT